MRIITFTFIFLSFTIIATGQYSFNEVFSEFEGTQLLQKVVAEYKPLTVLDYGEARDLMYGDIYNENDTVYGVYSHYGLFLPKNVDPSVYLYNDGKPSGINAEHTYPRSKGASEGNPKSDMHHLFPSKININSDRGSLPFNEIKDNLTNDWYFENIILHSKPAFNIDAYSEHIDIYFEPREKHKGNVARAMMYFYTMYKHEADEEDPTYFWNQIDTLCKWHFLDPVDSLEWIRTWEISKYQDDKPNPFVLDCSLATRSYCDFISDACRAVNTFEILNDNILNVDLYPNPVENKLMVRFINPGLSNIHIYVYNILGEKLLNKEFIFTGNEIENISVDINFLSSGSYILKGRGAFGKKIIDFNKLFVIN